MSYDFKMPKMGESIQEATIINWCKSAGDFVEKDEIILEVATDKVDTEVPSPVSGVITEIFFKKDAVVEVGSVLAVIQIADGSLQIADGSLQMADGRLQIADGSLQIADSRLQIADSRLQIADSRLQIADGSNQMAVGSLQIADGSNQMAVGSSQIADSRSQIAEKLDNEKSNFNPKSAICNLQSAIFFSPLIISIAQKENLSIEELQTITGSGTDGRLQKSDVYNYLKNRKYAIKSKPEIPNPIPTLRDQITNFPAPKIHFDFTKDSIIEMDRMRSMIANHMVYSKQTSPHVTSFIEVDVTNMVAWRNENKDKFLAENGEKLTFTPIFVDAVAKAIQDFPMINVSVDGKKIVVHHDINIGMATALPSGNLIVPVVKNANEKSLPELAKAVNNLAEKARQNKLQPDEIQGSTFTISNVGTFGSLMGTPIINQPEVAILALGIIKKRPEVITTDKGDEIAIRSMMYLSLSFDHRVVDGFLGGSFLRKVGDYLEGF